MNRIPPSRLANWDYFRFFLAVAETGSLSAAAQVLGVSHPTVRRQIRDLESSLSAKLFNRTPDGYVLTAEGERMVDLAKTMEITAHAIERCANGEQSKCAGRVTLAAAAGIGTHWLAPKIAEFRRQHPGVEVELNISRSQLDLMRLEADIALRMGDPGGQGPGRTPRRRGQLRALRSQNLPRRARHTANRGRSQGSRSHRLHRRDRRAGSGAALARHRRRGGDVVQQQQSADPSSPPCRPEAEFSRFRST